MFTVLIYASAITMFVIIPIVGIACAVSDSRAEANIRRMYEGR